MSDSSETRRRGRLETTTARTPRRRDTGIRVDHVPAHISHPQPLKSCIYPLYIPTLKKEPQPADPPDQLLILVIFPLLSTDLLPQPSPAPRSPVSLVKISEPFPIFPAAPHASMQITLATAGRSSRAPLYMSRYMRRVAMHHPDFPPTQHPPALDHQRQDEQPSNPSCVMSARHHGKRRCMTAVRTGD